MQFSKATMPLFTQLELFSHGLKNMMVNFTIFPGQHNHQIRTSFNHSGQFWRLDLETVENLYESIPRRTAAVLKTKGGPIPY
jgi:hypothetical protein